MARRKMARRWMLFETEVSWFVLASALDVALTFLVLHYSNSGMTQGTFVESNPLAQWFISHWGFRGMVGYKLVMTLIVVVIAEFVGRQKPVVARMLLWGGTIVVGVVVIHSVRLLLAHRI
ncbi:MAG: hypothetical protein DWI22_05960 [Planctomycetota bacterium]|nr:DUF5658 family protein [Planctomycetales bacterium]RLT09334.1 MAG: hypothetical protein DWI22_05960 [Planctomycetota bacterium]